MLGGAEPVIGRSSVKISKKAWERDSCVGPLSKAPNPNNSRDCLPLLSQLDKSILVWFSLRVMMIPSSYRKPKTGNIPRRISIPNPYVNEGNQNEKHILQDEQPLCTAQFKLAVQEVWENDAPCRENGALCMLPGAFPSSFALHITGIIFRTIPTKELHFYNKTQMTDCGHILLMRSVLKKWKTKQKYGVHCIRGCQNSHFLSNRSELISFVTQKPFMNVNVFSNGNISKAVFSYIGAS